MTTETTMNNAQTETVSELVTRMARECARMAWDEANPTDPQCCPGTEAMSGDFEALDADFERMFRRERTEAESDDFLDAYAQAIRDLDPR